VRNKVIRNVLLVILLLGLIFSVLWFVYPKYRLSEEYPQPSGEFEIQGLMWSPIAYYYNPFIYQSVYNPIANANVINDVKMNGSDYVLMKAFYSGNAEGEILGDEEDLEPRLVEAIESAHENNLKVLLIPFVDSHDYWVLKEWTLAPDDWTQVVLKWARFAEENDVEMFCPGVEMNLIFDDEESGVWMKEILPQIREVYSGLVTTAEHPYLDKWENVDNAGGFAGYDCVGMAVFPVRKYEGNEWDIRSMDDLREEFEKDAQMVTDTAETNGIDCKLVVPFGVDFWNGEYPDAEKRAEMYNMGLDVFREYDFTGVFFQIWQSESDFPNVSEEVGGMLQERWVE